MGDFMVGTDECSNVREYYSKVGRFKTVSDSVRHSFGCIPEEYLMYSESQI